MLHNFLNICILIKIVCIVKVVLKFFKKLQERLILKSCMYRKSYDDNIYFRMHVQKLCANIVFASYDFPKRKLGKKKLFRKRNEICCRRWRASWASCARAEQQGPHGRRCPWIPRPAPFFYIFYSKLSILIFLLVQYILS